MKFVFTVLLIILTISANAQFDEIKSNRKQFGIGALYQPILEDTPLGFLLVANNLIDSLGFQIGYHAGDNYTKTLIGVNANIVNGFYLMASLDFFGKGINDDFFNINSDWNPSPTNSQFSIGCEIGIAYNLNVYTFKNQNRLKWQNYLSYNSSVKQVLLGTGIVFFLNK